MLNPRQVVSEILTDIEDGAADNYKSRISNESDRDEIGFAASARCVDRDSEAGDSLSMQILHKRLKIKASKRPTRCPCYCQRVTPKGLLIDT